MRRLYQGVGLVVLFLGLCDLSWGQITMGTVLGTVRDSSGAVLPGTAVRILNTETGLSRTANTDGRGYYTSPNLSLGQYEVTASLSGFRTEVRRGITLTVGQNAVIDFTLQVGSVTETVEVTAEAPLVETTNANVSGLVNERQVQDLPLNARSLIELAPLHAGVAFADSAQPGATKGFAVKLTIAGTRYISSLFQLDGIEISDTSQTAGSATGNMLGAETIREFNIITNGYSAQYGKHTGGVFNAVTKSGTNSLHGSVFEFLRNDKLDARNFFDKEKLAYKRNQFGGSVGGPIVKDRSFYFGSYEGLRERQGKTEFFLVPGPDIRQGRVPNASTGAVTVVPVTAAVRPYLDSYPLPNGAVFADGTAEWNVPRSYPASENYITARIDHTLSDKDSLFGRYTFDRALTIAGSNMNTFGEDGSKAHYAALGETRIFSPAVINQFLFGFTRTITDQHNLPVEGLTYPTENFTGRKNAFDGLFPHVFGNITVPGFSSWGGSSTIPKKYVYNSLEFKDDVFYSRGSHSFKFGFETSRMHFDETHSFHYGGTYAFNSIADFLQGISNSFNALTAGTITTNVLRQKLYGLYAQDDIRLTPRLTLNLGLRYEFVTVPFVDHDRVTNLMDFRTPGQTPDRLIFGNPAYLNPSLKNFSPRVGLAWDPKGSGKTSIRVGAGIFYDQIRVGVFAIGNLGNSPPFYVVGGIPTRGVARFPDAFFTQHDLLYGAVGVEGVDYRLKQPAVYKYSLDIQREVVANTSVTLGFSGTRGVHLMRVLNMNMPVAEVRGERLFIRATAPFLHPAFGRIRPRFTDATSDYYAMRLSGTRRFSQGLQFQASYTLSKTIDDGSNWTGSTDFSNSPGSARYLDLKDRGLAAFDIRNNFSANFTYDLPGGSLAGVAGKLLGGWQTSAIVSLRNGNPFTVSTGVLPANQRSGNVGDYPDVAPGNPGYTYDTRNPNRYYDPSSFVVPFRDATGGFIGNAGRDILIGPGTAKFDFVLVKETSLSERLHLQFRSEFFNLFNRANFGLPEGRIFANAAGAFTGTVGRIRNTKTTSRQVQFGLRLVF